MKTKLYLFALLFTLANLQSAAQLKADFEILKNPICAGEIANVVAHSPAASIYLWKWGNDHQYYSTTDSVFSNRYNTPGTYIVKLLVKDAMGRSDSTEKTIRVVAQPQAQFNLNQSANMNGVFCLSTEFSITQWSNISGFDSLSWDFGDGYLTSDRYPYHTYDSAGVYNIELYVEGACGANQSTQTVKIVDDSTGKPNLRMYLNGDQYCLGSEVNIQVNLYEQKVNSFQLFTGDGNSTGLDEFAYAYTEPGTYTLMGVGENECGIDTAKAVVTIGNDQNNNHYFYSRKRACKGTANTFTLGSDATVFVAAYIDYGDGSLDTLNELQSTAVEHKYALAGSYRATAIFEYSNCALPDTVYTTAYVDSIPNTYPMRVYVSSTELCANEEITINGPSINIGDTLYYDLGDGTILTYADENALVKHTYSKPGTYDIKLTRNIVCGSFFFEDSAFASVNVNASLPTTLNLSSNRFTEGELGCINDSFTLRLSSYQHPFNNPSFTLPDGSTHAGDELTLAFDQVGSYEILAKATNYCGVEVKAALTIDLTNTIMNPSISGYSYPRAQCVNQPFLFDMFTKNATNVIWNFGDGTTIKNPFGPHIMHQYADPGTYQVKVTASNGCGETVKNTALYVEPGPTVDFTASKTQITKGESVTFTNNSIGATRSLWVFNKELTDTSYEISPTRTYDEVGVFPVRLLVSNEFGCWDTLTKTITVKLIDNITNYDGKALFEIYPNPNTGVFTMVTSNHASSSTIQLADMRGQVVYKETLKSGNHQTLIDASSLPPATYFVRLQTDSMVYVSKILIVR